MGWLWLGLSIAFNIGANIMFKLYAARDAGLSGAWMFGLGLGLGAVNAFFLTCALKDIRLGVAYPIFSAVCIALMVLVSFIIFREKIELINIIGMLVIVVGIVLVTQ